MIDVHSWGAVLWLCLIAVVTNMRDRPRGLDSRPVQTFSTVFDKDVLA